MSAILFNNFNDCCWMKDRILENPSCFSKNVENEIVFETIKLCISNFDIFEKFYNENKDLYFDISNKMSKIK
jgi:hypothetical protein